MDSNKFDWEDLRLTLGAVGLALLSKQIGKRQAEKRFHKDFSREMARYQLEDKKGGQE